MICTVSLCNAQYTPINIQWSSSNHNNDRSNNSSNDNREYKNTSNNIVPYGYVDLGLPSGTLWKTTNENGYYSKDELAELFGYNLPSTYQWRELINNCTWSWSGNGYRVSGPNGNHIFLPCAGYRNNNGEIRGVSERGYYWLSNRSYGESYFEIEKGDYGLYGSSYLNSEYSVRLVLNN